MTNALLPVAPRTAPVYERGRTIDTDGTIYPDDDGLPMSDNTLQFEWIVTLKENLEALFANAPDVFVAGNLLWYPVQKSNDLRRAPDVFVAFGRPKGYRGSYQQWLEDGVPPQVVFEILSPGNRFSDMMEKRDFYEQYGVEEYYVYDPRDFDLTVWNRVASPPGVARFALLHPPQDFVSTLLGVRFEVRPGVPLRLYRSDGQPFLSFTELMALRDAAQQERNRAERERDVAVARAERLAARLRELGEEPEE